MRKSAQTEQDVLPIVGQCLEGIQRCTDSINEKEVGGGKCQRMNKEQNSMI